MEMDEKVQALLRAPVGRALVAHLAGLDVEVVAADSGVDLGGVRYRRASHVQDHAQHRSTPPRMQVPPLSENHVTAVRRTVRTAVADRTNPYLLPASSQVLASADEGALLRELGELVENIAFGATSGWLALQDSLTAAARDLQPAAEGLVQHPATAWWWDAAALNQQCWCGVPPVPSGATMHPLGDDDARPSQRWWLAPDVGLATTRAVAPDTCVVALCREGHTAYVEPHDEVVAPAEVAPCARVYEVSGPQAWTALVEEYPQSLASGARPDWEEWSRWSGTWWVPDWRRVADDWDGVHVGIGGYLSAAYRALPVRGGSTFLAGWDPDATAWLSDVVDVDTAATGGASLR